MAAVSQIAGSRCFLSENRMQEVQICGPEVEIGNRK